MPLCICSVLHKKIMLHQAVARSNTSKEGVRLVVCVLDEGVAGDGLIRK